MPNWHVQLRYNNCSLHLFCNLVLLSVPKSTTCGDSCRRPSVNVNAVDPGSRMKPYDLPKFGFVGKETAVVNRVWLHEKPHFAAEGTYFLGMIDW